jgi:hypothetical protein
MKQPKKFAWGISDPRIASLLNVRVHSMMRGHTIIPKTRSCFAEQTHQHLDGYAV